MPAHAVIDRSSKPATKMLTTTQAAERLNINIKTLYKLLDSGRLAFVDMSIRKNPKRATIRIDPMVLEAFIRGRSANTNARAA